MQTLGSVLQIIGEFAPRFSGYEQQVLSFFGSFGCVLKSPPFNRTPPNFYLSFWMDYTKISTE